MKKVATWVSVVAFIIFVIDWGVVGLKLLDGDYDIETGVYIGMACYVVILVCAVYKVFSNKCPHCGKVRISNDEYCSYCGKKIK